MSFITVLEMLPHRKIIAFDVAGDFLEFDWFYEEDKNTRILDYLKLSMSSFLTASTSFLIFSWSGLTSSDFSQAKIACSLSPIS